MYPVQTLADHALNRKLMQESRGILLYVDVKVVVFLLKTIKP